MPKNLVLFSDGTGNSAGKLFKTNVWRVYQAVDLADPQDPTEPRQFAFYDDGVGTSPFKPLALLGGAFGIGLARNVVDLYVFLCRTYEPGDRIYAFGFSRGAFTMRVLVGLVMSEGLLRYHGSEADLQRLARDAYRAYRAKRFPGTPLVTAMRRLRDAVLGARNALSGRGAYDCADRIGEPSSADPLKVHFLGLWDTVDAYGLPVDELTRAIDRFVWPLTMRDYDLAERVECARHALAIDDERNAFRPRLWNEEPMAGRPGSGVPGANRGTTHIEQERISQVWFAGVHSNVGGGYPDDGLSHVSLLWILGEARRCGLRLERRIFDEYAALSDENGPIYDSRRGVAAYYRYNPRRIERLAETPDVKVPRIKVHESVLRRIQAGHDGYAPFVLPPGFAVVRIQGDIVEADAYLREMKRLQAAPTEPAEIAADAARMSAPLLGAASPYGPRREIVFNTVWRRRVAYFTTLAVTLALLAMPLFAPATPACASPLCFLTAPLALLGDLLPAQATAWTGSFASHPEVFLPLLALLVVLMRWGHGLEARIRDQMRCIWYAIPALRPASAVRMPEPEGASAAERAIERLRTHPAYVAASRALVHGVLPAGFLVGLAYGAVALGSQVHDAWRASSGALCGPAGAAAGAPGWFDTRSECWNTGLHVREGATLRIRLSVPAAFRWSDDTIPAGPNGFECRLPAGQALAMAAAVPLRRHPTEPWFRPIARIGVTGNDTYALRGQPQTAPLQDRCEAARAPAAPGCPAGDGAGSMAEVFESEIVARSSGPLFLYVNDAVRLPFAAPFHANNAGCARVEVLPVLPAPAGAARQRLH